MKPVTICTMAQQRVALVTGASRGIGRAISERLARDGMACVGVARSAERLHATSGLASARACDITDPLAVRRLVRAVIADFGRLDVLVNCAGLAGQDSLSSSLSSFPPGSPDDSPPDSPDEGDALWHAIIAVNLHAPYYLCKAAIPHLPDGSGRIINIGSVLSLMGVADQAAYCAAKHGVLGLTRALAAHLAPRRITVNLLAPGWTDTDMARQRWAQLCTTREQVEQTIPLGRVLVPDDIAGWAAFLASGEASMVTGQVITIDGGSLQH